jgi:hypothetical protein
MKTLAVLFAILAVFCVYGFIASFEPGPRNAYFRIGYPIVGLVSLVAARMLWGADRRNP